MIEIDVVIRNEGSIFVFQVETDSASAWVDEHVGDESLWVGNGLIVEHRYAHDLAQGMIDDGLEVR